MRLTRQDKEALLSMLLRGYIVGRIGGVVLYGRLIRKGMVKATRHKSRATYGSTSYELTDAGFKAAKEFLGREEPRRLRGWRYNRSNPKQQKPSPIRLTDDRFGYRALGGEPFTDWYE